MSFCGIKAVDYDMPGKGLSVWVWALGRRLWTPMMTCSKLLWTGLTMDDDDSDDYTTRRPWNRWSWKADYHPTPSFPRMLPSFTSTDSTHAVRDGNITVTMWYYESGKILKPIPAIIFLETFFPGATSPPPLTKHWLGERQVHHRWFGPMLNIPSLLPLNALLQCNQARDTLGQIYTYTTPHAAAAAQFHTLSPYSSFSCSISQSRTFILSVSCVS